MYLLRGWIRTHDHGVAIRSLRLLTAVAYISFTLYKYYIINFYISQISANY